jgi:peptidoglycan/LPS O-acetylase OafA/YrhL
MSKEYLVTVSKNAKSGAAARKRRNASLALALVVVAGVAIVSFLPSADKRALHTEGRLHNWLHLAVFTVVGFVASRAAHSRLAGVVAFAGAVLFGFALEAGEHFVFHNHLEWKDVLVDAMGVTAGTLLAMASSNNRLDAGPR